MHTKNRTLSGRCNDMDKIYPGKSRFYDLQSDI